MGWSSATESERQASEDERPDIYERTHRQGDEQPAIGVNEIYEPGNRESTDADDHEADSDCRGRTGSA